MAEVRRPSRVASTVITAAFKAVLPGTATRVQGITDIANEIISERAEWRSRNTLSRRLQDNADLLEERLEPFEHGDIGKFDEAEKNIAIEGACKAIEAINITEELIIRQNLNSAKLRELVRPAAMRHWKESLLSEKATQYGEAYLNLACRYLITLVRDLPNFSRDMLIENYALTQKLYQVVERSINSVIQPAINQGDGKYISDFEARYLSSILNECQDMELFGLKVEPEFRRQPINIAYITLMAAVPEQYAAKRIPLHSRKALLEDFAEEIAAHSRPWHSLPVDKAFQLIITVSDEKRNSTTDGQQYRGVRILLVGPAGSGKTTITQWLATQAAQHRFPESLGIWNSCVPFIIPLRELYRDKGRYTPSQADLIGATASAEIKPPDGWLDGKLNGQCLIVFDGLDELGDVHRSSFTKWLQKFGGDYRQAHVIVTSRPDGLDEAWFSQNEFDRVELQPMSTPDILRCIESWFEALFSVDPRRVHEHQASRKRLIRDIERPGPVRDLAETPLLCAMLCAFYANDLSMTAPETRGEVYDRVISTLVDARERRRKIERIEVPGFRLKPKLQLLQALARHLTENDLLQIKCRRDPRDSGAQRRAGSADSLAIEIVEERLSGMPPLPITADETLDLLLERSVVFREVGYNEAEFAHRSIQEYLAACDYAANGLLEELVHVAAIPSWRRIAAFAAGRLATKSASHLIDELVTAASQDGARRRELLLLAAECYSAAGNLQPDVAERAKSQLATILPPQTLEEADLIATGGDQMLSWLSDHESNTDSVAIACMRAASVIGTPAALEVMAQYAASPRGSRLADEIIRNWIYFGADEYASQVVQHLPLDSCTVAIESTSIMEAAGALTGIQKARIEKSVAPNFVAWSSLRDLSELNCGGHVGLASLSGVGSLRSLLRLNLSGSAELTDLRELASLHNLRELYLTNCTALADIKALRHLKSLRVLVLDGCTSLQDLAPLAALRNLRPCLLMKSPLIISNFARISPICLRSAHVLAVEFVIRSH